MGVFNSLFETLSSKKSENEERKKKQSLSYFVPGWELCGRKEQIKHDDHVFYRFIVADKENRKNKIFYVQGDGPYDLRVIWAYLRNPDILKDILYGRPETYFSLEQDVGGAGCYYLEDADSPEEEREDI